MKQVLLYNRNTQHIESEKTYQADGLAFLYKTKIGKTLIHSILNKKMVSKIYGQAVKSRQSRYLIKKFIHHYNIDTSEIKQPIESFRNFNAFFIRELVPGARPVDETPSHLISPADSRLMVFDLANTGALPVKGYWYSLLDLVKDKKIAQEYHDGWCFVYRLAPSDYHRFCYIDNGTQTGVKRLRGVLHSVNPIALSATKNLLSKNYRELTVLETENFEKVVQLEVGALLVGKIVQRKRHAHTFRRGEEKGWFEYGGSTIIQLFKKQYITPDPDILEHSVKGIETLVKMGEKTGAKL
ncbi:MAG TPA: phosphatidylserine decarboxylase [Bacteroidales bacterium]|nr:phosphatidylserine decarboxylase [Bacteroidales bacterium]